MKTLKNILTILAASGPRKIAMLMFVILSTIFSCKEDGLDKISDVGGKASVTFHIDDAWFEDVVTLGKEDVVKSGKKAPSGNGSRHTTDSRQKITVAFNKDFNLMAELSEATPSSRVANSQGTKAGVERNPMEEGIRYKVIIFDNAEKYVTEKEYVRGKESTVPVLLLDGGKEYTFIVYSINKSSSPPPVIYTDNNNKTLRTSTVFLEGNMDFVYAKQKQKVIGGITNLVPVSLKHKLSQITTIIDASQSGYNITAVTSGITRHSPKAFVNLFDGALARSGIFGSSPVVFPKLSSQIVTSTPTIVNADVDNASYNISSITIGPITKTSVIPFTDLLIKPGVKYNMTLTLTPADGYLTHESQQAVRINGDIWMRLNIGASTTSNPDNMPYTSSYHGNYYQWGGYYSVANGRANKVNSLWESDDIPPDDAWNRGSESSPIKSGDDPCPEGYRVPTRNEYERLFSSTTASNIGEWKEGSSNYSAAKVLTSNNNKAIKIIFPIQGFFSAFGQRGTPPFTAGEISLRGISAGYHTSTSNPWPQRALFYIDSQQTSTIMTDDPGVAQKFSALPIRCIAEKSN